MNATPAASDRATAQRNRILDAAQKCFAERGFHGASMASIADTALSGASCRLRSGELSMKP